MDTVSKALRSKNMAAIKSSHTSPELILRKIIHRLGYRYTLHKKSLPGKPDIYLRKYNTLIFVNGCFWHHHQNCRDAGIPKSNRRFWIAKLERNIARDEDNLKKLQSMGYNIITFWQCEIVDKGKKEPKTNNIVARLTEELKPHLLSLKKE